MAVLSDDLLVKEESVDVEEGFKRRYHRTILILKDRGLFTCL